MVKNMNAKVTFENNKFEQGLDCMHDILFFGIIWNGKLSHREQDLNQPRDVPARIYENLTILLKGDPGSKNNCT